MEMWSKLDVCSASDCKHSSGRQHLQENMQRESLHVRGCKADESVHAGDVCDYQVVFALHVSKCTDCSMSHGADGQAGAVMMGRRYRSCKLSWQACFDLGSQTGMKCCSRENCRQAQNRELCLRRC